jgi:hypothetical protein
MGGSFFRDAEWLNRERVRGYLWIFALLNVATLLFLVFTARNGVDRNGFLLGTDFLSFWTAGRMLHGGADVYDAAAHAAAQRGYFAQEGYVAFFYPPPFLLLCYPLGLLSYFPALALWLLTGFAAFFAAAKAWLRRAGVGQSPWLLAAAFPPVLITVTHGQTSFLVAALLGIGTLWVRERPILAGVCFGLAIIKPQFGPLVPLVLLLTGEWRAIAAAAATAVLLGLASSLAFGPGMWSGWIEASGAAQAALSGGTVGYAKMQSPFAAALLLGMPMGAAYAVQGVVALAVVGTIGRAAYRRRFTPALGAAMLAGAPLITPFVLDYDLVILAFPLIWLAGQDWRPGEKLIAAVTFAAAVFARPLAVSAGVPIMPLILAAFFLVLVRRALGPEPAHAHPPFTCGG